MVVLFLVDKEMNGFVAWMKEIPDRRPCFLVLALKRYSDGQSLVNAEA